MPGARILAIIPAFNESARIGPVVAAAKAHLPVLVVDDGSTDDTAAVAVAAGATLLQLRPNQGKGAALQAGFRRALADGWDAVVTLDADGQHDPAEVPQFLALYRSREVDLILGTRRCRRMPPVRRVANYLGRIAFSWALGRPVRDNQSGYRLMSRRLLEAAQAGREQGFEFEVEVIVLCVERGLQMEQLPIRTIYGGQTSHIRGAHHLKQFLRMVLETRRRTRRLLRPG